MNGIKRTYYITKELEEKIRTIAYYEKTTMSEIVRRALDSYYPKCSARKKLEEN